MLQSLLSIYHHLQDAPFVPPQQWGRPPAPATSPAIGTSPAMPAPALAGQAANANTPHGVAGNAPGSAPLAPPPAGAGGNSKKKRHRRPPDKQVRNAAFTREGITLAEQEHARVGLMQRMGRSRIPFQYLPHCAMHLDLFCCRSSVG